MNRKDRRAAEAARKAYEASPEKLGDAPVEAEYHARMTAVMQTLNEFINGDVPIPERKTGIVVMMFDFGSGPSRCNYMSNGVNRQDIVTLMKEMIARFEGQPELKGSA